MIAVVAVVGNDINEDDDIAVDDTDADDDNAVDDSAFGDNAVNVAEATRSSFLCFFSVLFSSVA